jgi:hypothetical protein
VFNISEAADKGSAGHEHMHLRATHGVAYAVQELDRTLARWNVEEREAAFLRSRLLRFEWTPPKGAVMELRLALMPDFSVERVHPDARFHPGALFTGQFDVMWAEPVPLFMRGDRIFCPPDSALVVSDYKFGTDAWVHTIEANLQLGIYGYLAARWTQAKSVVPSIIFPGPGEGDWDVDRPWGERELDAMEQRIRALLASVDRNRLKLAQGEPLELKEGRHCLYCPARSHCPAKTALFKRVLGERTASVFGDAPLTNEQASRGAAALPELERAARELKEILQDHVRENGPIDLEDGVVWGPERDERDEILSSPARAILVAELGSEYADEALRTKISKKSIEDAVKRKHDDQGIMRRVKPTMGRILGKLGEAGAIVRQKRETWCAHRPQQPALAPRPASQNVEDLE